MSILTNLSFHQMDSPEAEGVTCLGDALSTFENQQRATIQQVHVE